MTDRLEANESLGTDQLIKSKNGLYQLILQDDGNLVLYGRKGRVRGGAVWASGTNRGTLAILQSDGNFVLYGPSGQVLGGAVWASGTNSGTSLIMQDDGNLVIYRSDGRPVWATDTVEPPPPPPQKLSQAEFWQCRADWSSGGTTFGKGFSEQEARRDLDREIVNDKHNNNGIATVVKKTCYPIRV